MKPIVVRNEERCEICFTDGVFKTLSGRREEFLRRGALLFTDGNVYEIYRERIEGLGLPLEIMPAGEENKNERTLFSLLRAMAESGLRRNSLLVVIGGGVACDLGGLAAALYMRGVDCILVPTTLLAQVDASVGGKTAIDFCGVKNLVGVFRQPAEVYIGGEFLDTLPPRELRCGLGEIVKHAALYPALFDRISRNAEHLSDANFLKTLVKENIEYKRSVVRLDSRESGARKRLNLGHTTAHVIEAMTGLSHGESVLLGLTVESKMSESRAVCDRGFLDALRGLCLRASGEIPRPPKDAEETAVRLASLDKKNRDGGVVVVTAPTAAGEYALLEIPAEEYARELVAVWRSLC